MLSLLAVTAALAATSGGSDGTTIRFDGIGPLRLGMTLDQATRTGVLRTHTETCLDRPVPLPVVYGADGPRAAPGARYSAYFRSGTLQGMMFASGVRTELGVRPGVTTGKQMVARYRRAGYTVRSYWRRDYLATFVDVIRANRVVMSAVSQRGGPIIALGIPRYFRCDR